MNIEELLLSKVHTLFRFPLFLSNVLFFFLFQHLVHITLVILSPKAPLGCDSSQTFLVFDDLDNFEEYWSGI